MTRKRLHGAETYLLVALLVFGIAVSFLLPVGGGYDEETHLMRVWEMSAFAFMPNEELGAKMPFPAVYWEMSYRRQPIVRAVEADFWDKYGNLALDAHDYIYGSVETRSVYAPPLLLPQALVMRYLGRSWEFPALIVFYACRLIGLLSYILLAWLAVRLIPFGKWVLAILAASPVAILQASTISADAISNGIAFLFIGGSLAIAMKDELRWKEWAYLALLLLLLFWGKVNIIPIALLPFLLIKPSQFKIKNGLLVLALTAIVLFVVEILGWNLLAYSRLHTAPEGTDPVGQIMFILGHPLKFSGILGMNIWLNFADYLRAWIAIYGFDYWPVPVWTYYLCGAGLLAALLVKETDEGINKRTRIALGIVFAITYLATISSLYVTFTPVGSEGIQGVQGRYFTTVMPLLFLTLAGLPFLKRIHIPIILPVILGATTLLVYTAGMYLSYHVTCGSQYYQAGLCYQPNYKNWAPNELYSPPVSDELTLTQEIVAECAGMTELRVWVNATGADPHGATEFILRDPEQNLVTASNIEANTELPGGGWYSLHFRPDWKSDGKLYVLTIHEADKSSRGPRIAYSLRPEYLEGRLYENSQPIEKDLIFQVGCISGIEKIRLTNTP